MLFLAQLLHHAGFLDQPGPFVGAGGAACDQAEVAAAGW